MLKLKKVAITGSLSSGKTTVCHIFKRLGAYVLSADNIVHQLLSSNREIHQQIIDLLGDDVVHNKELSRPLIAKKVFGHKDTLRSLENLLHPAVSHKIDSTYRNVAAQGHYPLFVVEIPLLFESGWEESFDYTLVVDAAPTLCQQRSSLDPEHFAQRMEHQWPREEKISRADAVIDNNGTPQETEQQVTKIFSQLTSTTR